MKNYEKELEKLNPNDLYSFIASHLDKNETEFKIALRKRFPDPHVLFHICDKVYKERVVEFEKNIENYELFVWLYVKRFMNKKLPEEEHYKMLIQHIINPTCLTKAYFEIIK